MEYVVVHLNMGFVDRMYGTNHRVSEALWRTKGILLVYLNEPGASRVLAEIANQKRSIYDNADISLRHLPLLTLFKRKCRS